MVNFAPNTEVAYYTVFVCQCVLPVLQKEDTAHRLYSISMETGYAYENREVRQALCHVVQGILEKVDSVSDSFLQPFLWDKTQWLYHKTSEQINKSNLQD